MFQAEAPGVEAALLDWSREWCELLAEGELAEACARLDEPNSYGVTWTPQAILQLVHETFNPETLFGRQHPEGPRFTSPRTAVGGERIDVGAFADGSGFWVWYDLPLNGEFSDLTAQLEFLWRGARLLAVRLHDLDVM